MTKVSSISEQRARPSSPKVDPDIRPYVDFAEEYIDNNWIVFPLPAGKKFPPVSNFTGGHEPPSRKQMMQWIDDCKNEKNDFTEFANIGIRATRFSFGMDIDDYDEKNGMTTLHNLEEQMGHEMPETWISSARVDGASGIRHYLLPASQIGKKIVTKINPGIEIAQYTHRYMVAPPSVHAKIGRHYKWYAPGMKINGRGTFAIPALGALPVVG